MERTTVIQLFAVFLLCALMPFLVAPTGVEPVPKAAAYTPTSEKWDVHGPYVDAVIFKVITGSDVQVDALIKGEIDHLADNVPSAYISQLEADPNINVTRTERLGFGFMIINCQRYPFSIREFRRALAYAADKHEVASLMWGGLGFALDTPVPASCGVWHNAHTDDDFKSPDKTKAEAELAKGGFVDIDGDGWVEAPNGEDFEFEIMYAAEAPQWTAAMMSQKEYWDEVGIPVKLNPIAFNTLLDRVYTIPRNYDGACYAYGLSDPLPLHLQEWTSDNIANPEGNQMNWANTTYDAHIDTMMTSSDYDEVLDAALEAQNIFVADCPMIVWYSNWEVNAHRIDRFEGWVVSPGHGTGPMNHWNPRKVHLKEGQPDRDLVTGCGGVLRTIIAAEMDSQNPLTSTSVYGNYPLSQIYMGLTMEKDPRDHSTPTPGIAYEWTSGEVVSIDQDPPKPTQGLKFIFHLYDNATWHDGTPVTAEDVEFSYNYIKEKGVPTYLMTAQYLYSCQAIDEHTVEIITNGTSYWSFDQIRGWTILPKHIWEGIISPVTFTNPLPVGCGPFKWYRRIEGEYVELRFWEQYHLGIPGHYAAPVTPQSMLPVYIGVGVLVIVIVLIGSIWYLRKK